MKRFLFVFVMAAAYLVASCSTAEINAPAQQQQSQLRPGQETSYQELIDQIEAYEEVTNSLPDGGEKEYYRGLIVGLREELESAAMNYAGVNGITPKGFSVRTDTLIYWSTDCNGNPIELSGFIHFPLYRGNIQPDMIKGMVINCHATKPQGVSIGEIASDFGGMKLDLGSLGNFDALVDGIYSLKQLTADGVIVLEPDYEGFGLTSGRPQTYLCHKLIAKQCADMIEPALSAANQIFGKDITGTRGFASYITGYSQGGGQALALTRYLTVEDKTGLLKKINLVNSVCGAGPYDPQLTFHTWLDRKEIGMSVLLPMVLCGYMAGHPDIMAGIDIKSYFSEEYNNYPVKNYGIPQRVKDMNNGFTQGMRYDIEHGEVWGVVAHRVPIYDLMSETAKDSASHIMQALDECLVMEQVCYDWTPVTSVILLAMENDNMVPVENTHTAYDVLRANAGSLVSKVIVKHATDHILGQIAYTGLLTGKTKLYKQINK